MQKMEKKSAHLKETSDLCRVVEACILSRQIEGFYETIKTKSRSRSDQIDEIIQFFWVFV